MNVVKDVLEWKAGAVTLGSVEVVGLDTDGRGVGGEGLAEAVRGGKIVE